ncbi:MAG: carboxypeptidase regulatory-like domain-containing protein, partial [Muribaculaceae bacterium]|nr:carboxypeptidase regulatory-like domain-containing protein [Muribaculaceae bacterium]
KEMTTNLEADSEGKVTFKFNVTVENNGDIDFPESEEGFTIELKNQTANYELFGSGKITEGIPCGTSVSKDFTMTGVPVIAGTYSDTYVVVLTHEKTGTHEVSLGSFKVIPYLPSPKFMFDAANSANQSNNSDVNITDVITIGAGAAGTSRTLCMWNYGTAPLEVTEISMPEGFTADVTSFTLEPKGKKDITIALSGDAGLKKGTMTFVATDIDDFSYTLQGLVTSEGDYAEDFEGEGQPEGMVIGKNWTITEPVTALKTLADTKYIQCTSSSTHADRFSTPLLSFKEGEKLYFMASKSDNTGSVLKVYTSTDRSNWTLAKTITASTNDDNEHFNVDKPTGQGYGTYEFSLHSVDVPAGECYVQFEAGAVRLDNIHGGKLVDIAHDLYVVNTAIPSAAEVNTRFITNVTLRNLSAKAESDYSVILEVNGEKVAEATETPELAQGADTPFELRYTPHAEGEYKGQFVFLSGTDRVNLGEFEFTVGPEKAEASYQVGDIKITTSDPLNTYYNAQSQIIYRADQLGMDEGVKITGFKFIGYSDSEVTKNVKVWIQNTDVDAFDPNDIVPAEKEDMTLVFDKVYTFPAVGDNATKTYEPTFLVPFSVPFTYEGKSIRIMIEQTDVVEGQDKHHVFFCVDNSVYDYWNDIFDNRVIENKKEYAEDLDDEPSWSVYRAGFPVTFFSVAKDVVVAKGCVTDEFGTPVENVNVSYTSDDVLYSSVTDAKGNYSMNIANVDLTYTFTAKAESDDYETYTKDDVTFDVETEPEAVSDVTLRFADRTATLSGTVLSANGTAPTDKVEVILTAGEKTHATETDADGKYSLTVAELAHTYAIEVKIGGATYHTTAEYNFASKVDTKHFTVDWAPVAATGTVTDEFGAPVDGATISYTSGDVAFSTTTGADGKYALEIDKLSLTYTFMAAADGFDTVTVSDITLDAADAVRDLTLVYTDRTATLSGTVLSAAGAAPTAKIEVTLTAGGKSYTAQADADGKYTVTVPELSDKYDIDVKVGGETLASEKEYAFESKADTKDFVVEWSSISAVEATAAVKVTTGAGAIYVEAEAGVSVSVYAINGTLIATELSHGEQMIFNVAPGVYVVAGVKVLVR